MTPKQKAEELIEKYLEAIQHQDHYWGAEQDAQTCALIAVDEIIDAVESFAYQCMWNDFETGNIRTDGNPTEYWHKVKTELEKL